MAILAVIRDLVATRGAQLISRYAGIGLGLLGAKLGVTAGADTASTIGAFAAGGLLLLIDHLSHGMQKKAE